MHKGPAAVLDGGAMLPGYNHDDPVAVVDGSVMIPGYNHDDPEAVVDGGVVLPGYNHDDPAAVVNGRLYVGWDGVSHHEVPLVDAQLEPELAPLQVLY